MKSLRSRLLSGGIWAFSAKAGTGFLTIALTALVTRILDPESVGVLFLSFSIVIMISVALRCGLDQLGIKLIGEALSAGDGVRAWQIASRIIRIVGILSAVAASIIYLFFEDMIAHFMADAVAQDSLFRLLFSLWLAVVPIQLLFAELFRAYRHIGYASVFSGGTLFGGFGVGIVSGATILVLHFSGLTPSLTGTVGIIVASTFVFLAGELLLIRKVAGRAAGETASRCEEAPGYAGLAGQGFPFFITMLSLFALIHMDTVILGLFRPEEEVAVYGATSRLVKLMLLSLIVAYEVAAPFIVELNATGERDKLEEILRGIATLAALPAVAVLLLFVFASDTVLGLVYGEYYEEGAAVLVILSIGQLINVWTGLSGYTLNMLGYQKLNMYVYSSVTIVALVLCLVLAGPYGLLGVASIISVAWAVQNILTVFLVKHHIGIWVHARVWYAYKAIRRMSEWK